MARFSRPSPTSSSPSPPASMAAERNLIAFEYHLPRIHKMGYTFPPSPDALSRVGLSHRERRQYEPLSHRERRQYEPLSHRERRQYEPLSHRERRQYEPLSLRERR